METSTSLIRPFLTGVIQDIRDLYPEHGFLYEGSFIDSGVLLNEELFVSDWSSIGKAMEISLITGSNLRFSEDSLNNLFGGSQVYSEGACYPRFLDELWSVLFCNDGLPRFRCPDSHFYVKPMSNGSDVLRPATETSALALLCLRQCFLGLSKLSTLECLCRPKCRNRGVQGESLKAAIDKLRIADPWASEKTIVIGLLRRQSATRCSSGAIC